MKYNPNVRWQIAALVNTESTTYEPKFWLALNYNAAINPAGDPDFADFDYTTARFCPLNKIKIVRNAEVGETPDVTENGRDYMVVIPTGNFDDFDTALDNIDYANPEKFYYLWFNKVMDFATTPIICNQMSLILIHKKDGLPYTYSDFPGDDFDLDDLDATYDVVPIGIETFPTIDSTTESVETALTMDLIY